MCDVIDKKLIFLNTSYKNQKEIFNFIADEVIKESRGIDKEKIIEGFYEREKEYSTAINDGIAIPHCRINEINKATVIVLRNKEKIIWTENEDIDIIFALLIPKSNENQMHIKILAQVAQLIMEDDFIKLIKDSENTDDIFSTMNIINTLLI